MYVHNLPNVKFFVFVSTLVKKKSSVFMSIHDYHLVSSTIITFICICIVQEKYKMADYFESISFLIRHKVSSKRESLNSFVEVYLNIFPVICLHRAVSVSILFKTFPDITHKKYYANSDIFLLYGSRWT